MINKRKILVVLLSCALLVLLSVVSFAQNDVFNEDDIVLRFAMLSDTHSTQGMPKFERALDQLYAKAGDNTLDAVVIAGDVTDNGTAREIQELKGVLDRAGFAERGTEFIFTLGNHDTDFDELPYNGELFKQILGDYAFKGATEEEIKNGNHHMKINGFHILALNCKVYYGGASYAPEDLAWLTAKLAEIVAKDPDKPIFLATHPVVYGTTYGSTDGAYWYSKNLDPIIKNYPQVIVFAGHLHFPLNSERSIYQGDYTAINTASVYYASLEGQLGGVRPIETGGGMEPRDMMQFSQGLYLEVDSQGNTRIHRMDFFNQAVIKEPWVIPAPKMDKSHLLVYNDEVRTSQNEPPYFPEGASAEILYVSETKLDIEFDAAFDDDMVYYYEVYLLDKNTGEQVGRSHAVTYSDFYRKPDPKDMAKRLFRAFDGGAFKILFNRYDTSRDYAVKIVAVDSFGGKSEPLYSEPALSK